MSIATSSLSLISQPISSDSVTSAQLLPHRAKGLVFEVNGTGEFSVRFETSTNGSDWYSIQEVDPFSVDSIQSLSDDLNILKFIRAKIDIGSSGSVSICAVHFSLK